MSDRERDQPSGPALGVQSRATRAWRAAVVVAVAATHAAACTERDPTGRGERAAPSAVDPPGPLPSAPPAAAAVLGAPSSVAGSGSAESATCRGAACPPPCATDQVFVEPPPAEGFVMGRGEVRHGFGKRGDGNVGHGTSDTPHRVMLSRGFCMDANEVSVDEYRRCVDAGHCAAPVLDNVWMTYPHYPGHEVDGAMPVNQVDWGMARAFCRARGRELPTEAQWDWAAGGAERSTYPWGEEPPTCEHADFSPGPIAHPAGDAGCHGGGPSRVGSHPRGDRVLPGGRIHDLAGNVWEWCLDSYAPLPEGAVTDPAPLKSEQGTHVIRGGGWNRSARGIGAAFRAGAIHDYTVSGLGFRCVTNGP